MWCTSAVYQTSSNSERLIMFDWFKRKEKKTIVIPSKEHGPLRGAELIRAFSTEDEPKVKDFPKEKYKCYWEIQVDSAPGGYKAVVKFCAFDNSFKKEFAYTTEDVPSLRKQVTKKILEVMSENRK